ncbi:MAG TPA: 30S ribosome-binding factor RbfA [Bacillota bacterium]|nr:MAG: Ribosome-binding factor A [Firmicutes bacterium ADurb.Bin153]HNV34376.1 30S ribosome-binding factor RbfA [Bacillota bacterium]HPU95343.1 30S ribosome-binding factor RbfA [Bacillota bacterium]
MSFRRNKVQDAIRDELSAMLTKDLSDPRLEFASVTAVELSSDMSFAKVFISSFRKDPEAAKSAAEALEAAKGRIRGEIGRRLGIRHSPELNFRPDHSMERAAKVLEILNDIKAGTEDRS